MNMSLGVEEPLQRNRRGRCGSEKSKVGGQGTTLVKRKPGQRNEAKIC